MRVRRRLQDLKIWRRVCECVDNQKGVKLNFLGVTRVGCAGISLGKSLQAGKCSSPFTAQSQISDLFACKISPSNRKSSEHSVELKNLSVTDIFVNISFVKKWKIILDSEMSHNIFFLSFFDCIISFSKTTTSPGCLHILTAIDR